MSQYIRIKPVFTTFHSDQIRNHSKENKIIITQGQSRMEDRSQSVEKFKHQIIHQQTQQNEFNEHLQTQITKLTERMNNAELNISKMYSWLDAINIVQDDMQKLQSQLKNVQNMIIQEEEKSQQCYIEQINQMKYNVIDQIHNMETEFNKKIEQIQINIQKYNDILQIKISESNDVYKYEKFNQEISIYLKNNENLQQQQQQIPSPKYKNKNQKLQLEKINELENSSQYQSFQFLQSQSLQYQLDNDGYLLLNGDYLYDSIGKKQRLSCEQIKYLNLIPK